MDEIIAEIYCYIANNDLVPIIQSLKSSEIEEDLMDFIMTVLSDFYVEPPNCKLPKKNCNFAKLYKDQANSCLIRNCTSERLQEACQLFTKSLAFAPEEYSELAQIYADRAAVLLKLKKYEECILDIDHSLSLEIKEDLRLRLTLMKIECLVLSKNPQAKVVYKKITDYIGGIPSKVDREKMIKRLENCYQKWVNQMRNQPKAASPSTIQFQEFKYLVSNEEIPSASDALELRYDCVNGRHIVATREVKAGEILAEEKPFCSVPHMNRRYAQCWGCLKDILSGVPCEGCPNVVFCDSQCKKESWEKFHDVECRILPSLLGLAEREVELVGVASLRMTIMAVKELGGIEEAMEKIKDVALSEDDRTRGFADDGKFYSHSYSSVCSLLTNTEYLEWEDAVTRSVYVAIIVYYLATETFFFGSMKCNPDWTELLEDVKVVYIAGLLLKNYNILAINAFSENETYNANVREEGALILPFLSLLNHSCDPNVSRSYHNGRQVLFAIRPIDKGEQICRCYGLSYTQMPLHLRHELLYEQYYFICNCNACTHDLPLKEYIPSFNVFLEDEKVKRIVQQALLKIAPYAKNSKSPMKMSGDIPRYMKLISDTLQIMSEHVKWPCKEAINLADLLRNIYQIGRSPRSPSKSGKSPSKQS